MRQLDTEAALRRFQKDESSAFAGRTTKAFLPESIDEIPGIMRGAQEAGETLTLRAAGTSITGAPVPTAGGWLLSTERLRNISKFPLPPLSQDPQAIRGPDYSFLLLEEAKMAVVPGGLRLFELSQSLERYRLSYPPDPTELSAMIGGTIATNASGARSFHYGATRKWVEGLLVVFPNGEFTWIHRGDYVAEENELPLPRESGAASIALPEDYPVVETKNAAGLYLRSGMDLVDLFIGSEGILGVIAGAIVRLTDRPQGVIQTAAFFPGEEAAYSFADTLRADGGPLSIEYFDPDAIDFMRDHYPDLPPGRQSCVLFEIEPAARTNGNPYPSPGELEKWIANLRAAGSTENWSVGNDDVAAMKEFRHSLPESVNQWVAGRKGKLGTDLAVPGEYFRELCIAYDRARERERSRAPRSVLFGHLGQFHLHLNFLPASDEELAEARRRYLDLARYAVSLGGTVSAEHGVGKKRLVDEDGVSRPYLYYMLGDTGVNAIRRVKAALDPGHILNPDTMIPKD